MKNLPHEWQLIALGSILKRVIKAVDVDPETQYREIGIRSHGRGIFHKEPVSGESLGDKRVFWVVPDALVLNIVFAWEQAVAITSGAEIGMIASHRFPMYRPIEGRCDLRYLLLFLKTPRGKDLLELASPGGAGRNKTLGQREFERLKIPLPPIAEQRRIAGLLDACDHAIALQEQLIEMGKRQRLALVEDLLSTRHRLPGYAGAWQEKKLSDLAEVIVSPVDKKSKPEETQVLLCNYTDVYYNDFLEADHQYMSATAKDEEIDKFRILPGDILITKDSETADDIGAAACVLGVPKNLVCAYHLAIVRPRANLADSIFLSAVFSLGSVKRHFRVSANGVTRFGLPLQIILNLAVRLPAFAEQRALGSRLQLASEGIRLEAEHGRVLKLERLAAMRQLFGGVRRFH